MLGLGTAGLAGCTLATISVDGMDAGGLELRLGPTAADVKAKGARR
jgi:hypothetical protein